MDPLIALLTNKTLIVNVLGLIFTYLGAHYAINVDVQTQTVIVGVVMVILNAIVEHLTSPKGITVSTPATNIGAKP